MIKEWYVSASKNGAVLHIQNRSFWATALEEAYGLFIEVTDHRLCCRMPDVLWKIPVGVPDYDDSDDEKFLMNSVAGLMHTVTTNIEFWLMNNGTDEVATIDLDEAVATIISPDLAWIWSDDDDNAI